MHVKCGYLQSLELACDKCNICREKPYRMGIKNSSVKLNETVDLLQDIFSVLDEGFNSEIWEEYRKIEASQEHPEDTEGLYLSEEATFFRINQYPEKDIWRFIPDSKISALFESRFGEGISGAELSLLKGLLCSKTLKEISEEDNVTYQTRRNQLSNLCQKAQLKRQTDLVLIMTALLTSFAHSQEHTAIGIRKKLCEYLGKYYSGEYRVHAPDLGNGRRLLIADLGPLDGKPCLMMHSSFLPIFPLPIFEDYLAEAGIRVITPIRPGYFDVPLIKKSGEENHAMFVDDLVAFVRLFNFMDAPIISQTHGLRAAIDLAARLKSSQRPVLVNSPAFMRTPENSDARKHHLGLNALVKRSPKLLAAAIQVMVSALASTGKLESYFQKTYSSSPPDLKIIRAMKDEPWFYELAIKVSLGNLRGITNDYTIAPEGWADIPRDLGDAFKIIIGAFDPFIDSDILQSQSDSQRLNIEIIEDFGQNSAIFDPEFVFSRAFPDLEKTV